MAEAELLEVLSRMADDMSAVRDGMAMMYRDLYVFFVLAVFGFSFYIGGAAWRR